MKQSIQSILEADERNQSLVKPTSFLSADEKPLENSGYLFFGYNLHRGNPHSLNGSVDPGFASPIFQSDFSAGLKTGDLRFLIPYGSTFSKNVGCDVSLSNKEIKGLNSYKNSLEADVSVSGGFWGVSFSASASYKHINEGMKGNNKVFIEQKADCRAYQGQINYFKPPQFDNTFIEANKFLSKTTFEESPDEFFEYINSYGTHFLDKIKMGARYGYLHELDAEDYSILKSHEGSLSVGAGYSNVFSAKVGFGMSSSNSNSGSSLVSSTKIFSIGANPPADGNTLTWASASIAEPMPIGYTLRPLLSIFTNKKFNLKQLTDEEIDLKKLATNLTQAYNAYCPNYLRPKGEATICVPAEIPADLEQNEEEPLINISLSSVLIRNLKDNVCLDSEGPSVVVNPCKNDNRQGQIFQFYGYMDTLKFRLANSKNLLMEKTSDNRSVFAPNVGFTPANDIALERLYGNTYYIKIGGHCLESQGSVSQVTFKPCNQGKKQRWKATNTSWRN